MLNIDILHDCAHILTNHIVNHILSLDLDVFVVRAGFPGDWLNAEGQYKCQFMEEINSQAKTMMDEELSILKEARVIIV